MTSSWSGPSISNEPPKLLMLAATDDSDGVAPEGLPAGSLSALEVLNEKYCAVFANGKYRIMGLQEWRSASWTAASKHDFEAAFGHKMIERDKAGVSRNAADKVPLGVAWQTWPRRRDGVRHML